MFPFSDEELVSPVEASIDRVRPMLLRDKGNIELIKIEDATVYVRFLGACQGCPSINITLKNGVLRALQTDIHPDIKVVRLD
ncbi:hypothetical protein BKH43_00210 [Helicobacter sp. 13S00401-1]|uniref:NifU family protein n=1 Tax=Helicobacter sp. 13S00401-1 TaxID=1905758 RepID=UPI000BA76154|nr:NifU family protein [Helicobacter sp. 13S00401-1]PAF51700.1 hypothetical protein BKH43_00210 [Helicobacter sp. 13S00401-1]